MDRYCITFKIPLFGEAIVEANTQEEAKEIAEQIAYGDRQEWIAWDDYYSSELKIVEVEFYDSGEKKQTAEEWLNDFQDEIYND